MIPIGAVDDEIEGLELDEEGAFAILRRGIAASPELRPGLKVSLGFAFVIALGRLLLPIAVQQIIDRGFRHGDPSDGFVYLACGICAALLVILAVLNGVTYLRLLHTAQNTLFGLRTRSFDHVHALSLAHHNESKRGVLVSRVTADVETLAQFAQWGAISWLVNLTIIVVTLAALAVYAWQLALVTIVVFLPLVPIMRFLQRRQLRAYDSVRTAVGETLTEVSEAVTGASVIRAYVYGRATRKRLHTSIRTLYKSNMRAAWFFSLMFALSDLVGGDRARRSGCRRRHIRAGLGTDPGDDHRRAVPGDPDPEPGGRDRRGTRSDPDRPRRLAKDPRSAR